MAKTKSTKPPRKRKAKKSAIEKYLAPKKFLKSSKQDIKDFRKAVSALRKLGLAFSRTSGRKAKPTTRGKKILQQFEGVLSGKEKAYKVGKKQAREFSKINIKASGDKIILPVKENEKIVTRKGKVFRHTDMGGTHIRGEILPVAHENLRDYIDSIRENRTKPAKGKNWAFRMFGNNSYLSFDNLELLANYLEQYVSVQLALASTRKAQQEIISNLELIEVTPSQHYGGPTFDRSGGWSRGLSRPRSDYSKTYYERLKKREPKRYEATLEKANKKSKARYEAIKKDPEKLKLLRQKERERYARSKNK